MFVRKLKVSDKKMSRGLSALSRSHLGTDVECLGLVLAWRVSYLILVSPEKVSGHPCWLLLSVCSYACCTVTVCTVPENCVICCSCYKWTTWCRQWMNNSDIGILSSATIHHFLHVYHSSVAWYKRIPYL